MAARATKIRQTEETRLKIKTSQLINRLNDHALGTVDLSATQVKSIEILLRKTLPDLSAIDANLNGETVSYVVSAQPMNEDDWEATYSLEPTGGSTKGPH